MEICKRTIKRLEAQLRDLDLRIENLEYDVGTETDCCFVANPDDVEKLEGLYGERKGMINVLRELHYEVHETEVYSAWGTVVDYKIEITKR